MDQGYYRYPSIAHDRIVYVCEDDLWSVPAAGGDGVRLTVSFGSCSFPRISPDGESIAFISTDEGNPELYVMPAHGGEPQRLTFLGATLAWTCGWNDDGSEIYFVANPTVWYEGETRPFAISRNGGTSRELNLGHARALSFGTQGRIAIGRNAADPARWKRYRGGTAGEVWVDESGAGEFTRLPLPAGNPCWPMWIGDRIFFLSDHEGLGNIYSCLPDGSDVRRHTHESEYYVRFPSTDGARIVYSAGAEIGLYNVASDTARKVDVLTNSPAPQTARRFANAAESLADFEPHPDGTQLAFDARGQQFTMPLFEGAVVRYGTGSRARTRLTQWFHDGKQLVSVTDVNGYEQIALGPTDAPAEPSLVTSGDIGRVTDLVCSPTTGIVAFANHRHELCVLDVDDGKVRVLDSCPSHRIDDLAFSPDGRYLAYVWWPAHGTSIIRIVKIRSGKVHDVTSALRMDQSPAWDPDGKYLYFISTRDFNPVYDALQFDLSFPQASRPFVVTLRGDVQSPFVPKPKPIHHDHERERERERGNNKPQKPVDVEIDFDGITGRVLGFPVDEGDYNQIVATRERVLFTRFPVKGIKPTRREDLDSEGHGSLLAYDFDQQRVATIATECDEIRLGRDGRTLVYRSHDRLRAIDALNELPEEGEEQKPPTEPGRRSGWLELDRASVEIVPRDEWAQMYREAWRLQTEQFWVEDMSDIDWDRVYDRYAAVLPRVRTRGELSDLIWEMQGELGTSHAYEWGGDYREPPQYQRGFLGADLRWDEEREGYCIERIYRGDSWNRESDSPLAEPGQNVHEGDCIVAIGGKRLSRETSPDRLLVNAAGRQISVTLRNKKGEERIVLVKALENEAALRYRAWVEANRRSVHERTGERVGYLHIPDMGPWGFSEFHRGYLSEFDRKGLIVDVRYNRGGHVSPLLLEKLARRRVGYDTPRYGAPIPYPPESVGGPMVALTNQFAGSDGDIFSHCFKLYKLGPLVGKRTWGGVIGIDPYHHLVDGTLTTQPEFSFWFVDVGWGVENHGTDPDYDVDIAPHQYRDGKDPQLDVALELMEKALEGYQEVRPDLSTRPSLPLPTLA
jgi:tricorn protease